MNRLINMILRRVMNQGVRTGINAASRGGKDFKDMSKEERQQARSTADQLNQGRRMFRIARRFLR